MDTGCVLNGYHMTSLLFHSEKVGVCSKIRIKKASNKATKM